jgi:hypothetical protein
MYYPVGALCKATGKISRGNLMKPKSPANFSA